MSTEGRGVEEVGYTTPKSQTLYNDMEAHDITRNPTLLNARNNSEKRREG